MIRFTRTQLQVTDNRISRRYFLGASLGGALYLKAMMARGYAAVASQTSPQISATELGGVTLFQGAACTVSAMRGESGALMIHGGLAANPEALRKAVKERTGNCCIYELI